MAEQPRIILVNGVSGSGKTSLCIQLARQLHYPYVHICMDRFYEGLPQKRLSPVQRLHLPSIYRGFLDSAAAFVNAGNRILLDMVLSNTYTKQQMIESLDPIPTCLVGLDCRLETLEIRNAGRADRRGSLSAEQLTTVHADMHYDLMLDTGVLSPPQGADKIITYLDQGASLTAFRTLRQEFRHAS